MSTSPSPRRTVRRHSSRTSSLWCVAVEARHKACPEDHVSQPFRESEREPNVHRSDKDRRSEQSQLRYRLPAVGPLRRYRSGAGLRPLHHRRRESRRPDLLRFRDPRAQRLHLWSTGASPPRRVARWGASASGGLLYPSLRLQEDDEFDLGEFQLRVVHTPGHTPEHISFLVVEKGSPTAIFTGGALMLGGAARVDLLGSRVAPFWRAGSITPFTKSCSNFRMR